MAVADRGTSLPRSWSLGSYATVAVKSSVSARQHTYVCFAAQSMIRCVGLRADRVGKLGNYDVARRSSVSGLRRHRVQRYGSGYSWR